MGSMSEPPGYLTSRLFLSGTPVFTPEYRKMVARDIETNYAALLPQAKDARILEIGFGVGGVLDWLKEHGYSNCEGLEADRESWEFCRHRHKVWLEADAAAFLTRKGPYRVILMKNVIAHLPREEAVRLVRACTSALEPGGRVLLETFNGGLLSSFFTLSNDLTHQAAYTENSLRQLLLLGGLAEISVEGSRSPSRGMRRALYCAARWAWCQALRFFLALERGLGGNPQILTKFLIGSGTKPTPS